MPFFHSDNAVNFDELNVFATNIYREYDFRSRRIFPAASAYTLTEKQMAFIGQSLRTFESIYSRLWQFYKDKTSWNLVGEIWNLVKSYFNAKRMQATMGPSQAESMGFFRGLIATWQISTTQKNTDESKAIAESLKAINSAIKYFGEDYQGARLMYLKFIIRFCIRFEQSLELIKNDDQGLKILADYIAMLSLDVVNHSTILSANLTQLNAITKPIYLLRCCVDPDNSFEIIWDKNKLETEGGDEAEWDINNLLCWSPKEGNTNIYYSKYPNTFFYPAQICKEEECQGVIGYQQLDI